MKMRRSGQLEESPNPRRQTHMLEVMGKLLAIDQDIHFNQIRGNQEFQDLRALESRSNQNRTPDQGERRPKSPSQMREKFFKANLIT